MKVDKNLVQKVASLAKLKLTAEEVKYYEYQLSRIINYVEELSSVEVNLAKEDETNSFREREDGSINPELPENALLNAPLKSGTSFEVPRIIEEEP